jgi:hypothetical protein
VAENERLLPKGTSAVTAEELRFYFQYTQFDYMSLVPAIQASPTCSNYTPMKDKKLRIREYSTLPTQKRETTPRKMQN